MRIPPEFRSRSASAARRRRTDGRQSRSATTASACPRDSMRRAMAAPASRSSASWRSTSARSCSLKPAISASASASCSRGASRTVGAAHDEIGRSGFAEGCVVVRPALASAYWELPRNALHQLVTERGIVLVEKGLGGGRIEANGCRESWQQISFDSLVAQIDRADINDLPCLRGEHQRAFARCEAERGEVRTLYEDLHAANAESRLRLCLEDDEAVDPRSISRRIAEMMGYAEFILVNVAANNRELVFIVLLAGADQDVGVLLRSDRSSRRGRGNGRARCADAETGRRNESVERFVHRSPTLFAYPNIGPALELDARAQRQRGGAEGRARGQPVRLEVTDVNAIERAPLAHVSQHDGAFEHVVEGKPIGRKHGADILHGLPCLGLQAARH